MLIKKTDGVAKGPRLREALSNAVGGAPSTGVRS